MLTHISFALNTCSISFPTVMKLANSGIDGVSTAVATFVFPSDLVGVFFPAIATGALFLTASDTVGVFFAATFEVVFFLPATASVPSFLAATFSTPLFLPAKGLVAALPFPYDTININEKLVKKKTY